MPSVQCPSGSVERRGGGAVIEAAVFLVADSAPSLDRLGLGVYVGFLAAQVNLVPCVPTPHHS